MLYFDLMDKAIQCLSRRAFFNLDLTVRPLNKSLLVWDFKANFCVCIELRKNAFTNKALLDEVAYVYVPKESFTAAASILQCVLFNIGACIANACITRRTVFGAPIAAEGILFYSTLCTSGAYHLLKNWLWKTFH